MEREDDHDADFNDGDSDDAIEDGVVSPLSLIYHSYTLSHITSGC